MYFNILGNNLTVDQMVILLKIFRTGFFAFFPNTTYLLNFVCTPYYNIRIE